jgi:hypothetical protein
MVEYCQLAFACIVRLAGYRENLALFRANVERCDFIESIVRQLREENMAAIKAMEARAPISAEIHDGEEIEQYANGYAKIGPLSRKGSIEPVQCPAKWNS